MVTHREPDDSGELVLPELAMPGAKPPRLTMCVTSDQRSLAAYDNSQAASRIDLSGAYGSQSCVSGYVWRQAFGGDYVCVTPGERSQVAYDNSQVINRIVAL